MTNVYVWEKDDLLNAGFKISDLRVNISLINPESELVVREIESDMGTFMDIDVRISVPYKALYYTVITPSGNVLSLKPAHGQWSYRPAHGDFKTWFGQTLCLRGVADSELLLVKHEEWSMHG